MASTVANFASRQLPEGKSCAAADFFPDPYAEPEAPPSAEEMRQALALALGGPSDGR
ncbi:MAG: hypothetical protein HY794_18220 [Desulfarculus sp.]|nr:hypothetical protein [Desulfarculus sp.]